MKKKTTMTNENIRLGVHAKHRARVRGISPRLAMLALQYGKLYERTRGRSVWVMNEGCARRARNDGHHVEMKAPRLVVVSKKGRVITCYWNHNLTLLRRYVNRVA